MKPFYIQQWNRQKVAALVALIGWLPCMGHAQEQSMEERLRAQLRTVTGQLQQAQNELALLKSGGGTAARAANPPQEEALRAELAQSRQQLAREREHSSRRDAEVQAVRQQATEVIGKSNAQVNQFRTAYNELLKIARVAEAERLRLAEAATAQQAAITQCEAKNKQLHALGQEILQAYETLDLGTLISARQPFAAKSRVKFEEVAQQYGDKLYEGKFDLRSVQVPAAAGGRPGAPSEGDSDSFQLEPQAASQHQP
ncbi:hypothetical protein [Comamonas sp. UBA7528]|uniref:hypothetical protein n=1 Tax=Comamonas sp. UBA7528 TaxID=1946391 RepID=UPI0025C33BC5|nr:hypothetical protein [Comamonas sp. UBA7528]